MLLVLLSAACGRRDAAKDAAVETFISAVRASTEQTDSTLAGRSIATACAPLYSERSCREGYATAWDEKTSPVERSGILVRACSEAYCSKLADPKPLLCTQRAADFSGLSVQWQEFERVVLARDLGATRAERVLAAMKAAAATRAARGN